MSRLNLIGQEFGRLSVINFSHSDGKSCRWVCKCSCGKEVVVLGYNLTGGHTKSCGCLKGEEAKKLKMPHRKKLYGVWSLMLKRCTDPRYKGYKDYGGRGITVTQEWQVLDSFYEWALENGYEPGLEIDRIDNNKGYYPENCRFVSHKQNTNNRRTSHFITIDGITKTLTQWSEDAGVKVGTIWARAKRGLKGRELIKGVEQ